MKTLILSLSFLFSISMTAQQTITLKLWDTKAPIDNGVIDSETNVDGRVSNVSSPEITVYLPKNSQKPSKAVIICPGGGYSRLAIDHEGHEFAKWLQAEGIAGIVLKYRLPNYHKEVPLSDFQQAIRIVRSKVSAWNVDNSKIGICGFSAGGHLASTASTHFNSKDERPDFAILFYPVITMKNFGHKGSLENLLGKEPLAEDIMNFSNELQVEIDTPPTLLLLSDDDKTVPPINSTLYYNALKENNVKAAMYIFPTGGHGWGMRKDFVYHQQMLSLLKTWLDTI